MYKAVKKNNVRQSYMESLALHTSAPTENWKDNTNCIYFVEAKIFNPRVKYIFITVCFLQ